MKTVTLQIGNSDNKLTQAEWSDFVKRVKAHIEYYADEIFFSGFSPSDAPWQNACFVFNLDYAYLLPLERNISNVRSLFRQDSVAWIEGETKFI